MTITALVNERLAPTGLVTSEAEIGSDRTVLLGTVMPGGADLSQYPLNPEQ